MINIAYKQAKILHQFKESKEFIETMVKRLKMSKINMTFQINLYKIIKNYPFSKHFNKSLYYFKHFFSADKANLLNK